MVGLGFGCASSAPPDPGLEGLALEKVAPDTIIPGTKIQLSGASFVESQWGTASLHLEGSGIDVRWPAEFVDFDTMTVAVDADKIREVGSGSFHGTAKLDVIAVSDGQTYSSEGITVDLTFAEKLDPVVTGLDGSA